MNCINNNVFDKIIACAKKRKKKNVKLFFISFNISFDVGGFYYFFFAVSNFYDPRERKAKANCSKCTLAVS